jgi:phage repressor protein C with HTH and peptisase S24 domain
MAKVLARESARQIELHSINPDHPPITLAPRAVEWIARIVWASQ